jgi:apolipoprotein D and lipocalin family protein
MKTALLTLVFVYWHSSVIESLANYLDILQKIGRCTHPTGLDVRKLPGTMNYIYTALLIQTLAVLGFGQSSAPVQTVAKVDLQRYAGKWYEIARYPNRFQKQCAGNVTANYIITAEGKLDVINQCKKKNGELQTAKADGKVVDKQTNAKLKVRFAPSFLSILPFVWGDYWIIDLAPDYSYAVVSDSKRDYFWILSREPQMSETLYAQIMERAKSKGFDPTRAVRTAQGL